MSSASPRPHAPTTRIRLQASALLVAACLFWAGNFVLGRAAAGEVPPVGRAVWRWVLAGAVLAPFALRPLWAMRAEIMARSGLFLALGLFGVGSFTPLPYIALGHTAAITAALTNSLIPVAIILAALALDRERPAGMQLAGLSLSLAGVMVIVSRGDAAALAGFRINSGDLLMLVAVIAWGLYTVLLRRVPEGLRTRLGPVGLLGATIVFGLPVIWLCRLIELGLGGAEMPHDAASLALVAYTALFASIAAYLCWNGGVTLIGPAAAGPFLHLMPPFSAALAVPLLGEAVRPFHAAGLLLIVAGVALAGRR